MSSINDRLNALRNNHMPIDTNADFITQQKAININDIQLLVIPFLGVDKKGARLGYGSGYYDRAIGERYESKLEPNIIGLGYEYQLTESSFGESHDMRYNKVITESNIHSFR